MTDSITTGKPYRAECLMFLKMASEKVHLLEEAVACESPCPGLLRNIQELQQILGAAQCILLEGYLQVCLRMLLHDANRLSHPVNLTEIGELFRLWNRADLGVDKPLLWAGEPLSAIHGGSDRKAEQ